MLFFYYTPLLDVTQEERGLAGYYRHRIGIMAEEDW